MKVETKTTYTAVDNRTFEDENKAREYETELAIELLEEHLYHFGCDVCPAREICEWINDDEERPNLWDKQLCHYLS